MNIKELKSQMSIYGSDTKICYLTPCIKSCDGVVVGTKYSNGILAILIGDPGDQCMNVRELLADIENIPDDVLVTINKTELGVNNENILRWISCYPQEHTIAVNDKKNEDIEAELLARGEADELISMGDACMLQWCFDDGFTLEDFKSVRSDVYEWAKRTKEENALVELQERKVA